MGFRLRKALKLGPVRLNFTQRGLSSISLRVGPYTWNSRARRHTVNTPGPGSFTWGGKRGGA